MTHDPWQCLVCLISYNFLCFINTLSRTHANLKWTTNTLSSSQRVAYRSVKITLTKQLIFVSFETASIIDLLVGQWVTDTDPWPMWPIQICWPIWPTDPLSALCAVTAIIPTWICIFFAFFYLKQTIALICDKASSMTQLTNGAKCKHLQARICAKRRYF